MTDDFNSRTIFVAVPTMEDPDYPKTIKSLFDNARYPERVFVGSPIFLVSMAQIDDPEYDKFWELNFDYPKDNYRSDFFLHEDYFGVGLGRLKALDFYQGEKYYFQVDSHMRFKKDWDVELIKEYEECKEYFGDLVLLGQYAPNFTDEVVDGEVMLKIFEEHKLPFWTYDEARTEHYPVGWDYTFGTVDDPRFLHKDKLINGKFIQNVKHCAHNLFTESNPWIDRFRMCIDPKIIFWGEEFYQAALAWMRGYEFCWSTKNYVAHRYAGMNDMNIVDPKPAEPVKGLDGKPVRDYFDAETGSKKYVYRKFAARPELIEYETFTILDIPNAIRRGDFGYLPRSFEGWLKFAGVNMKEKSTVGVFYLPPLNPVFRKSMKGRDTNATTP